MIIQTDKNLHASVPAPLLMKAEEAAAAEHITLDELVADAVKRRVEPPGSRLNEIFAYGKVQARGMGTKLADVQKAIDEVRAEEARQGR